MAGNHLVYLGIILIISVDTKAIPAVMGKTTKAIK